MKLGVKTATAAGPLPAARGGTKHGSRAVAARGGAGSAKAPRLAQLIANRL
jgi:hypothetical protein